MAINMAEENVYLFFSGYCLTAFAGESLKESGIDCKLIKAPVNMRKSCSFALVLNKKELKKSIRILNKRNLNIIRIETGQ